MESYYLNKLPRVFYDPLGGELFLEEVAIDEQQLEWLRS